jgi:D-tyrosyl-tRNA(Tyr) deacylase
MKAVLQRVTRASVTVDDQIVGQIGQGLLVLLGVEPDDTEADAQQLADKTIQLRIFDDADGKMNLALTDVGGALLVVSQFTLLGDCRKGRRPSFIQAAPPEIAGRLYEAFVAAAGAQGVRVATGKFRAMMQVELVNDGPVTLLLDSKKAVLALQGLLPVWRRLWLDAGKLHGALEELPGCLWADAHLVAEVVHQHRVAHGHHHEHTQHAGHERVGDPIFAEDF